jgi:hypothetical protein
MTGLKSRRKETTWKTATQGGNNIKLHLTEIGWSGMGCINLAQDMEWWRALVKTVINFWIS